MPPRGTGAALLNTAQESRKMLELEYLCVWPIGIMLEFDTESRKSCQFLARLSNTVRHQEGYNTRNTSRVPRGYFFVGETLSVVPLGDCTECVRSYFILLKTLELLRPVNMSCLKCDVTISHRFFAQIACFAGKPHNVSQTRD